MSRLCARSGSDMRRTLHWYHFVDFGVGCMVCVCVCVFVTTGRTCHFNVGPAVIVSYTIAGLYTLFFAFCYTEFAVDMPIVGDDFSYLRVTFGEFAAFLTDANLIMEYVMSNVAVACDFMAYLGTTIGVPNAKWKLTVNGLPKGFNEIDVVVVAIVLLITFIIDYRFQNYEDLELESSLG